MKLEAPAPAVRVMIADDHEHVLWGLSRLVNGAYPRMHVVGAARSVTETVYMLRCWRPEVLVVSDRLAGECAIESLLRFVGSWPAAILVLMGLADPGRRDRAMRLGADQVMLKGCPAELMLGAIESLRARAFVQ